MKVPDDSGRCGPPPTEAGADLSVVGPPSPHDDLPFEQLAQSYNFRLTSTHGMLLTRLAVKECQNRPAPVRVLDIGCGRGIGRHPAFQQVIRAHADELWGVEPDETVIPAPGVFDEHRHAIMEAADLPAEHFDLAYSCMVMEHVADPDVFMQAVHRCLKPRGVYLFVTPNRRHYFTRTAALLHGLRLDEFVLRMIKRHTVDDYHYPVQYRFNEERRINACAEQLGFLPPEFVYIEAGGPRGYLPGPLAPVYHVMALKRKLIRRPRALLTIICRVTKPPRDHDPAHPMSPAED
jgi:2-polyprenyl-3-methyl-5-hydroxy-6-metoxy-1,4-benzoquinol methylase